MTAIKPNIGPLEALQREVAARLTRPAEDSVSYIESNPNQNDVQKPVSYETTLPASSPSSDTPETFESMVTKLNAILTANGSSESVAEMTAESARLQALQARQQLEAKPYGITSRAALSALAMFK
ncbi:hypothetical protein [Candidatus Phycosocius spiralis]|uniref:Anti-sigma-28 factor FlgM C-terminal domain-containing protein n=1 Tax=Candidatus Phycosocius spiralis TaxID=2815099 RepID=A0ABQ4PTP5_9PROT|nr:hypothetical protein [Candidatus Phycosocius spiralis]GIU66336.1 hypothetical protein PsB1_0490 [Candidatus Phycosocius spiralis]